MEKLIYLAIPYSYNPEESFRIANEVAANLMQKGYVVFSPISHTHPVSNYMPEEHKFDHTFWMKQDLTILRRCDELYIISIHKKHKCIQGHQLIDNSEGCQREIQEATKYNKPIKTIHYYEKKRISELS